MSEEFPLVTLRNGEVADALEVALICDALRSVLSQSHRAMLELVRYSKNHSAPSAGTLAALRGVNLLSSGGNINPLVVDVVRSMNHDGELERVLTRELLSSRAERIELRNPVRPDDDDIVMLDE